MVVNSVVTNKDCDRRHKYVRGAIVLLFAVCSLFVVLVGMSLATGATAHTTSAKVEQILAVYKAEQRGSLDRIWDTLLRIEKGIDEQKLEMKAQRVLIEQMLRDTHPRPVGSVVGGTGGGG